MHTINGTQACEASATAGKNSAAAVPDVQSRTAGFPVDIPMPSAAKAALRSS